MIAWRLLLLVWLTAALMMTLGWLWQRRRANAGIVDVLWSAGLAGSAVVNAVFGTGAAAPRVLVALLGGIWGARLAGHLWIRVRGEPEDGRYRALRGHWGNVQWKWLGLFQFQALLIALFSIPFAAAAANPSTHGVWLAVALGFWNASVLGESLADHQLAQFRARPENRGKTCRRGLWRYSRHPNYFFECLHWLVYPLLAAGSAWWWLSLGSPLVMAFLLLRLSGVPVTEAQSARSRPGYAEYIRTTSLLIPWPPKKS